MHPSLVNFSWYTAMDILGTHDQSTSFLQDFGLLPRKTLSLPCPKCGREMSAHGDKSRKLKWRFRCTKTPSCNGSVNPLENTFFKNSQIGFNEVLAIIFEFARGTPVTHVIRSMSEWRKHRGEKRINNRTVLEFYSFCRSVCQIVASHMSEEELETVKAAETYYRVNRLPKSLSEGEMIERFLEDLKSVFPGPESQPLPAQTLADSTINDKASAILNKNISCLQENFVSSVESTSDISLSNIQESSLNENFVNRHKQKRDLLTLNEDKSYPCKSSSNLTENRVDLTLVKDELSDEHDIVNSAVISSCMTLMSRDKSCDKENIINSPVRKKKCIIIPQLNDDETYHEENAITLSEKQ